MKGDFSVNGKLLVENLRRERTLSVLQENVIFSAKKRLSAKEKSSKDCQFTKLNELISKLNTEAMLLKSTISDLPKRSAKLLILSE